LNQYTNRELEEMCYR